MSTPADWPTATAFLPDAADSLPALKQAAGACRGCDLWQGATQTVFGRGNDRADVVLVGEQPGDVEDQRGVPFVGPAGTLLVEALDRAGLDRRRVWTTNAVKHFKFELRGNRRIHASPDTWEVAACQPWLLAELSVLKPTLVVLLGATAGKTLYGPSFRVTSSRGEVLPLPDQHRDLAGAALATIHPSAVLRAGDGRQAAFQGLVADLAVAQAYLQSAS